MRILIVESVPATAQALELYLKSEGFQVSATDLGEEAIEFVHAYEYDLVLLSLDLADMHGIDLIRALRRKKVALPIIAISMPVDPGMKIRCLDTGADDLILRPYHSGELAARIRAVVRRANGCPDSIVTVGNLAINLSTKGVTAGGRNLHLTAHEYEVLELLALRKGRIVSKEFILARIYGEACDGNLKTLDVFTYKLRKKIGASNDGVHYIETVQGRGLRLCEESEMGFPLALARTA